MLGKVINKGKYSKIKEGQIIQHTEYIAFGETFVDEHSVNPRQPYLFNGKELDFETGLYYYGARYYDPKVSLWLNVDPLAEKYPETSPYTYTLNNPIMLVDPDGNEPYCPSCKTKEDWDLYRGYWDNSISMMGGNMYLGTNMPSHIKVLFIDGNLERPYVSINGQVQDNIEELKNRTRLDVFSEFFTPIINIPEVVISKVWNSSSKGGNWFTRNIINPIKSLFSSSTNSDEFIEPVTNTIYKRPNNATTPAQRASVKGKECVTCGKKSSKMVADHKTPLVQEYYRTGTIDKTKMKSLEAVQPQCSTCSSKQGAEMRKYSQEMKRRINERTNGN